MTPSQAKCQKLRCRKEQCHRPG